MVMKQNEYHDPNDNWRRRVPERINPHVGCLLHFFCLMVMMAAILFIIVGAAMLLHG
jgi:hypothetical protein